ncbi:MAG: hypothetical protein ABFS28_10450 [Bacteroidota bacterium]
MKSNLISRLNFLRLGMASLAAFPLSAIGVRANDNNKKVKPQSLPADSPGVAGKYPPGRGHKELTDWQLIEESGAEVSQLTMSPVIHTHIYPHARIFTSDSRFFVYSRRPAHEQDETFWLCETGSWRLYKIPQPENSSGPHIPLDGDYTYIYYLIKPTPERNIVVKQNFWTGEREELMDINRTGVRGGIGSLTPDRRYGFSFATDEDGMCHIIRCDLVERSWKIIHSRPDIHNPHLMSEPGEGKDLLIQQNRDYVFDKKTKSWGPYTDKKGSTLYLIDINGENYRPLPIGKPHTPEIWGHQMWLGNTGKVLATLAGERYFEGNRVYKRNYDIVIDGKKGNLVTVSDKEEQPTVIAGGVFFDHVASSKDGKYFIADDMDGNIWVGSAETGKYRKLCNSGTILTGARYSHPHPFFSPDLKYAFFNSTGSGIPHIHAATIPEEFLKSLET